VPCHARGILPTRPIATLGAGLGLVLALAGCGSAPVSELPPAASLPEAPVPSSPPAGRVVEGAAPPEPVSVRLGGRTFTVDRGANAVRVLERGREVGRLRTGLEPAAIAAAGQGRQVAVLAVRERVVDLFDARTLRRIGRANAGAGPARLASDGNTVLYVTDATAGAVLVFHTIPELALERRYQLGGGPWALAYDGRRRRLWVTLAAANRVAELTGGIRTRRLDDFPSLRRPSAVAVAAGSGEVRVSGARHGVVQLLERSP